MLVVIVIDGARQPEAVGPIFLRPLALRPMLGKMRHELSLEAFRIVAADLLFIIEFPEKAFLDRRIMEAFLTLIFRERRTVQVRRLIVNLRPEAAPRSAPNSPTG